jgi:anti-sigma factor RsiW
MNCHDVFKCLNDYVDGLLQESEKREIEQHLKQCETCSREKQQLQALVMEAGNLPEGIKPSTDLWPGVAEQLENREVPLSLTARRGVRSIFSNRALLAAAAVLTAIVATAVTTTIINNRRPSNLPDDRQQPVAIAASALISSEYESAELEYRQATEKLLTLLDERRDSLSPETLAIVDENRRIIDQAIQEITDALEKEPGSPRLNGLLLAAYKKDLDLLRQAAQLPVQM